MAKKLFHPSVEGAQHGKKGLDGFLKFAKSAGAVGCQPSCSMLENGNGGFRPATEILKMFSDAGLLLDGISAHGPFWVHTTAWTRSPTMIPFLPANMCGPMAGSEEIEQWAEKYILQLLDLCAELRVAVVPMFWGVAFGWEIAGGYPWGFWKDKGYDLIAEGSARFVKKTAKIRDHARELHIVLAHEIHPGTAAICARDFLTLVKICDGDEVLGVNADPSHCWEGESWQTRFSMPGIAERVYACHLKNHHVVPGMPFRCMEADWQNRPMQFTPLERGDIDLVRYTELMIRIGYPQRYCERMGTKTAPLTGEGEGAYEDLDLLSSRGVEFIGDICCFDVATESFEDGMGAER